MWGANVSISPDKKDIYVTINVFEGERYTVSGVKLGGELLGLDEELKPLLYVKPGDVYNAEQINGISKAITDPRPRLLERSHSQAL